MKTLSERPARLSDLQQISAISQYLNVENSSPAFEKDLPLIRKSAFHAILNFEYKMFWSMFLIHIIDVHFSIFATLLSLQILRTYESGEGFHLIQWVNEVIVPKMSSAFQFSQLQFALMLALIVFVLNLVAAALHSQKIEREMLVSYRIQSRLTERIYEFILNSGQKLRAEKSTGDLMNLAQSDVREMAGFFAHAFVDFPVLFISVTVIVSIMYQMIGNAAFVAAAIVTMQIPISLLFMKINTGLYYEMMKRSDRRISLVSEWIQGIRLIRYFGWIDKFKTELKDSAKAEISQDYKLKLSYSAAFGLSTGWWMFVSVGVFSWFALFGEPLSASKVFGTLWLTSILGHQLNPLPWFISSFSQSIVAKKRLGELFVNQLQDEEFCIQSAELGIKSKIECTNDIETESTNDIDIKIEISDDVIPGIEIENLSVALSANEKPQLSGLNLQIPAGEITALVGSVGSGKSLLIQTLLGEIKPVGGKAYLTFRSDNIQDDKYKSETIQLKKINIHSKFGLKKLRSALGFVAQETFVLGANIIDNITLKYAATQNEVNLAPFISDDKAIVQSIWEASLETDVYELPQKSFTVLGDKGVNLSGGQRQRLSLARAAYGVAENNSKLIILDDPFSAVDGATEKLLVENLFDRRFKGKTVLWATHRLDYIARAQNVAVLENGCLVEFGKYTELISKPNSKLNIILKETFQVKPHV